MGKGINQFWAICGSIALSVVLLVLAIFTDTYWLAALPFILVGLYFVILAPINIFYWIAFFTPISINYVFADFKAGLSYPTEPLMLVLTGVVLLKFLVSDKFDKRILSHPITLVIFLNFLWLFITLIMSEMPVVSLKFILARFWFIFTSYIFGYHLFINQNHIKKYLAIFASSLVLVVLYSLVLHSATGFDQQASYQIMKPFFSDHTNYAACVALILMPISVFAFSPAVSLKYKNYWRIAAGILFLGLFFSYTRAAWISVVGSVLFIIVLRLKINFKLIAFGVITLGVLFFAFKDDLFKNLKGNTQDSSKNTLEHVKSISNVSTDASNVERLNRWKSAIRMWEDRPVFGFGPGTYMFQYSPYQRSAEMTIISTTIGDNGNSHSEYLGPLAEQGLPGMLIVLILFGSILATGMRVYYSASTPEDKAIALGLTLAFVTYFIHAFLNNFLDQDKLAVPFWAMAAMLVALDIKISKKYEVLSTEKKEID